MPLPDWLLWLLPVPLATVGAIAWGAWSSRSRGPQQPADSVQAYERFRAAMSTPVPSAPPGRRQRRPAQPPGARRAPGAGHDLR